MLKVVGDGFNEFRLLDPFQFVFCLGNGLIEEEEFVRYILSRSKDDFGKDMFSALLSAFEWFDLDRNGFIDKNEMR